MLRMNDDPHEELGAAHPGRDEGVHQHQSPCRLVGGGAWGRLRTGRAGTQGAAVSQAQQGAKGYREEVPGQSHGGEPSSDDAPDPALDGNAACGEKAAAAASFSATSGSSDWRRSRRPIFTTCGSRQRIGRFASAYNTLRRGRSRLGSGADPTHKAGPDTCAWIRCIKVSTMADRACTTSMPWIRLRNGRWSAAPRPSANGI